MTKKYVADNIAVTTFDNFPVTPSSAPTADYEISNKKYVDDNIVDSPNNVVIVNSVSDLPTPTDTADGLGSCHRLVDGIKYVIGANLVLSSPIVLNNNTMVGSWEVALVYAGSGALFRNNSTTPIGLSQLTYIVITTATGTNSAFAIDDGSTLSIDWLVINGIAPGQITGLDRVYLRNATFIDQKATLLIEDISDVFYYNGGIMLNSGTISDAFLTLKGDTGITAIHNVEAQPISGDSFLNIDSSTYTGRIEMSFTETRTLFGGIFFKSGSLDQTNTRVDAQNCVPIPDSQIIGSLYMERNTNDTSISDTGTTGTITSVADGETTSSITAFADAGGGQVTVTSATHGLTTGDEVVISGTTNYNGTYIIANALTNTFEITEIYAGDDATGTWVNYKSTVTSATHGKIDGDEIWIIDDDYTGQYFITNTTTNTFDIPVKFTSTTTGSWEDYWVKVEGTTIPMQNERASMTDNNEITFENLEQKDVTVTVSTNPKNDGVAAAKNWEFCVLKNGARLKGSVKAKEMTDKVSEGMIVCTTTVESGDVFEVRVRNILDTTDMIMENMSVVIS